MMNINELIKKEEYNFLRTNKNLKDNLIFLTLGGSHAYGTNVETSDYDVRGIAFNSKEEILLGNGFEQIEDKNTDTVIYSFNKILKLLTNCNPNVIELLGCKKDSYIFYSDIGKELIDNAEMFLSKRAINSFGGYANAQLRRLENALARDKYTEEEKQSHILGTIQATMCALNERYNKNNHYKLRFYLDKLESDEYKKIYIDGNFSQADLKDFKNLFSEISNIVKQYDKLNHRNSKKDNLHLCKHMMHLVRLYLTVFDIMKYKQVITYREKDLDLLMDIRNGKYLTKDGKLTKEFTKLIYNLEETFIELSYKTTLPDKPDIKKINEFTMYANESIVKNGSVFIDKNKKI